MSKQLPDMVFSKNKVNILVIRSDGDVEIELKTPDGEPVAGAVYLIRKQDGEKITGRLNDNGYAKVVSENLTGATIEFEEGRALSEHEASQQAS